MNTFTEKAKWIGLGEGGFAIGVKAPAIELRKSFTLDKKPESAQCLILGLGLHVLYINGRRVGDDVLSPAFTAFDKRSLYLRHDVTEYLAEGENVIAVKLGNGFFNETVVGHWNTHLAAWRNSPRLVFELFLDGNSILASDTTWRARSTGATVHNVLRTGEYYDARLADGWKSAEYCDTGWQMARIVHPAGGIIEEMVMPRAKECEHIKPLAKWSTERGVMYDFGKNMSGYVSLIGKAKSGATVSLTYGEKLDGKELDTENARYIVYDHPFAQDRYTFAGGGVEEWKPEFVYHGFRYVEAIWTEGEAGDVDLTAHFVHTDLRKKGEFACSDELMQWIYDAGVQSFLSNYQGHPLDCPHREKNGWTGDANISADYAVCLYDLKLPYLKWINDMSDAQRISGQLPGIIPTAGWGFIWGSGPAWDYAAFYLPFVLYRETGDNEALIKAYPIMQRYLEYAKSREDGDGLVCYGLSDWCPPVELGDCNIMPNRLSDSCYYMDMFRIAALAAKIQGDEAASEKYAEKSEKIKADIIKIYATDDQIKSHGQGALAFLLYFDVVEGERAEAVAKVLTDLMKKDNYVHKVGILGMKALPNALSKYGYTDVALKTLLRYDYPSYGLWKLQGETTLCEKWENVFSRNHHMYSDVVNWMIRNVAGLQNSGIAYDKATFVPGFFAKVCSASASTETPRGKIAIAWERCGDDFTADITVPDGTEATLVLPGKTMAVKTGVVKVKV